MRACSEIDVHNIKTNIEQTRRSSDKLIGYGPLSIGLDGLLTWVPIVGQLYTLISAGYLLTQGVKARVPAIVLVQMSALFLIDMVIGAVPIVGAIPDILFRSHYWAGGLLLKSINQTTYVDGDDSGAIDRAMTSGKRIVVLPATA